MSREFALPHSHAHWTRDRVVDIEHLRLVLDVDPPARRIAGRAELTLRVIAPGTRHVELDAVELTRSPSTARRASSSLTGATCASTSAVRTRPANAWR